MAFFDFMKLRKQKKKAERIAKRNAELQARMSAEQTQDDSAERSFDKPASSQFRVDPADIDPPATRFTDEYAEFIKKQEASARHANESEQ